LLRSGRPTTVVSSSLTGVQLRRHWVSLAGAVGGLLAHAGRDLTQPYLMGTTGHAFRLTLDVVISPSSPVELNFHDLLPLYENLGAWFKRIAARPSDPSFATTRAEALARIRLEIDAGRPVIAYDLLELPEYGLVVGYDQERLACLTLNNPETPEWLAVADWPPAAHSQFTRAEVITLLDLAPTFNRRTAEVASLRFAVDHFWASPARDLWLHHGKKAYEFWIAVLSSSLPLHGVDPGMGHSYNLTVLHRARRDAALYLTELAERYPEAPTLRDAAVHYGDLVTVLAQALELLPFPGTDLGPTPAARKPLLDLMRQAVALEGAGIDAIERALRALR
jgi:hypothetical protein